MLRLMNNGACNRVVQPDILCKTHFTLIDQAQPMPESVGGRCLIIVLTALFTVGICHRAIVYSRHWTSLFIETVLTIVLFLADVMCKAILWWLCRDICMRVNFKSSNIWSICHWIILINLHLTHGLWYLY